MSLFDLFKKKTVVPKYDVQPEPVEVETSVEDDLLNSIKQFRENQETVREKFLEKSDENLASVHQKIERAEDFISKSGINESIPNIIKHIWHWASWSEKESFEEYAAFKVKNIVGEKKGTNEWVLNFDYGITRFQFEFKEQKSCYEDESQYSDISLSVNDEKVLEVSCSSNLDRSYDSWDYLSVKSLVIGDWVSSVVEMDELIRLYELKSTREFGALMLTEQAENLPD